MTDHQSHLVSLDKRIEKLRGSIATDATLQVGGSAATALLSLSGPIPAVVSAGLFGFAVFLRGNAGQRRMLQALESIADILADFQKRVDSLDTSLTQNLTDMAETEVAKFLELAAREACEEKVQVAKNFLRHQLSQDKPSASPNPVDEEFERWLREATTLEIRAVLVMNQEGSGTDVYGRFPMGTYPKPSDLRKLLETEQETSQRVVDRLMANHLVTDVKQISEQPHNIEGFDGAFTVALALTELGNKFKKRME